MGQGCPPHSTRFQIPDAPNPNSMNLKALTANPNPNSQGFCSAPCLSPLALETLNSKPRDQKPCKPKTLNPKILYTEPRNPFALLSKTRNPKPEALQSNLETPHLLPLRHVRH